MTAIPRQQRQYNHNNYDKTNNGGEEATAGRQSNGNSIASVTKAKTKQRTGERQQSTTTNRTATATKRRT